MLDPLKPYQVPDVWTADHVLTRMKWAFQTLDRMSIRVLPKGFKSNWPAYLYEFADKVAQEEPPLGTEKSEAEKTRLNLASNTRIKLSPKAREIDLMDESFQWLLHHLPTSRHPQICIWARAVTQDRPPPSRVNIQRVYIEAGQIVAGLRHEKVPVR